MVVIEIDVIEEACIFHIRKCRLSIGARNADMELVGFGFSLDVDDITALALQTCAADALSTQRFPFQAVGLVNMWQHKALHLYR